MKSKTYDADDVRRIVCEVGLDQLMDDAIAALTRACRDFDQKSACIPMRDGFEYSEPNVGLIEWMPAMKTGRDVVIKMVGYHPSNPSTRDIPTILSTALSFDTLTGHLLAVMDATFLTALRTGAASAVASRILASPNSRILGLIGAGAQSISQLHALSRVFDLQQVIIYDCDQSACDTFSARAAQLNLSHLTIVSRPLEQLISVADIICTATSVEIGEGPVFQDTQMKPNIHINAVGSDFSGKVEIPHSRLQRSLVCPDFPAQALHEGECQQLRKDEIGPDLVELVKNDHSYSKHQTESTVFDSTGWAFEDYIVVNLLIEHGERLGYGKELELAAVSTDPKNPYAFLQHDTQSAQNTDQGVGTLFTVNKP